jgi:hypothetical protein
MAKIHSITHCCVLFVSQASHRMHAACLACYSTAGIHIHARGIYFLRTFLLNYMCCLASSMHGLSCIHVVAMHLADREDYVNKNNLHIVKL